MIVKICGITTREDAAIAAEAGASAIGFNFYPRSPRYVTPELAREIGDTLPPGILKVGIFVDQDGGTASQIAGLDVAQLYGAATAGSLRRWRACRAGSGFSAASLDDPEAEAFLLDTPSATLHGGTGESFDWTVARGLPKRIILAGGLDANNVRQAIEAAQPWGVDACSRLESSPGRKDPQKVREFVKAAFYL